MAKFLGRDVLYDVVTQQTEPRLRVQSGETVVVETEDAAGGRFRSQADVTFDKASVGYPNPLSGPIYVVGAKPGDTLVVGIESIDCDTQGYTRYRANSGIFKSWFTEPRVVVAAIAGNEILFSPRIRFPLRPMIGTIGVAPADPSADTGEPPGTQGGNMDCKDVRAGARLLLPVSAPGALLSLGDVHATQGDGEITGTGLEARARVTLKIDLQKGRPPAMTWPRLDLPDAIATIVSAGPMERAFELACWEMVLWLEEEYALDRGDAYLLLSNVGDGRVCQAVNTIPTIRCVVPKAALPPSERYPIR